MRFDLHTHTSASDGTLTPTALIQMAHAAALAAVAITDHDSVDGVAEAIAAADSLRQRTGSAPTVIPGVELSAVDTGRDVHVLGFFVDHEDPAFLEHLADLRAARMRRAGSIVDSLRAAGYLLEIDHVLRLSDGGAVGRSHVARALVELGHAADVSDAFKRLLGRGQPFYVPKDVRTPKDAIAVILAAGGLPVIAHPGVTGLDDLLPGLVQVGLAGLESYHSEHDPSQQLRYSRLAASLGVLETGGTDYHGPDAPNPPLGALEIPDDVLRALFERAGRVLHSSPYA